MTSRIVCIACGAESFADGARLYCWSCVAGLLSALKLSRQYLVKAVAEGLMTECGITPKTALSRIDAVIARVESE